MYEPTQQERRLLTWLNVGALSVHVLSASLGTALIGSNGNAKVPCIAPFVDFQTSPGGGNQLALPAPATVFEVGTLTGLLLFAWLTAAFHLVYLLQLYSFSFRSFVARALGGSGVNPVRWVEVRPPPRAPQRLAPCLHARCLATTWRGARLQYTCTAGIMAALANLNIGVSDFYLFLKVLCSNAAVQIIGFILELLDHRDPLHSRIASLLWNQVGALCQGARASCVR
jgi:hypothetical protein